MIQKSKKLLCVLLTLCLLLSLASCGGNSNSESHNNAGRNEGNANSGTSDNGGLSNDGGTFGTGNDAGANSIDEGADSWPTTLADSVILPVSLYHHDGKTYFMFAYQEPTSYRVEISIDGKHCNYSPVYNGQALGVFVNLDGELELADIAVTLRDTGDGSERVFNEWGKMISDSEYAKYGIYKMGDRYITIDDNGEASNKKEFGRIDLHIKDVYLLDRDDQLQEADIIPESFAFYAGDGIPLQEYLGASKVVLSVDYRSNLNSIQDSTAINFDFYPAKAGGTPDEQQDAVAKMLRLLEKTNTYYTYTDTNGTVHTVQWKLVAIDGRIVD